MPRKRRREISFKLKNGAMRNSDFNQGQIFINSNNNEHKILLINSLTQLSLETAGTLPITACLIWGRGPLSVAQNLIELPHTYSAK